MFLKDTWINAVQNEQLGTSVSRWLTELVSANNIREPRKFPDESVIVTKSRQSPESGERGLIRAAAEPLRALKIGHLNVRSLTAHLDQVNFLLLREQL